jgi:hypothetical protein
VNKNAPGIITDGASWPTAFKSVQAGIDSALSGDEVWVAGSAPAAPAYVEAIVLRSGVPLYGGFAGTETERIQRNWKTNVTIVDGNGSATTDTITSYSQDTVVDGFTIRNGRRGVYVYSGGATTVANSAISGCIYGVYGNHGRAAITNSIISGNSSTGISLYIDSSVTAINCTICANSLAVNVYSGGATLTNCIVAFNGAGISRSDRFQPVTLSHSDVYGSAAANFINVTDPSGSAGNISQDPKLTNSYHDIHIQPRSPCVDTGDDAVAQPGWTDIDGQPRIIGAHVDIGSDESDGTAWTVPSRTWFVKPTGDDGNDGTSWGNAKKTIGGAIVVAKGTDELWIASGVYRENVSVPPGVSVFGGWAGTETFKLQRDWKTNISVLDGGGTTSSSVVTSQFVGSALDGFTVRNSANGISVPSGIMTIANCSISATSADGYGINVDYGTANVAYCTIGGGASRGVYVHYGSVNVSNCAVIGSAKDGINVLAGTARIASSTIAGFSNGITVSSSSASATVTNCIVAFNRIGISASHATLSYNDFYGNTFTNYWTIPDPTGTDGNISEDPLFGSQTDGDFRLQAESPCIDAGDNASVEGGQHELDGKPRIIGAVIDMGAYEFGANYYVAADAVKALQISAGVEAGPPDSARWNVSTSNPGIDIIDGVRIARKATGLDTNP